MILRDLTRSKRAHWFLEPVDAEALGLDDYHKIIKYPMDLGTVVTKLDDGVYTDIGASLVRDIRCVMCVGVVGVVV